MTESIYPFTEDFDVTPSVQADFDKNGYIIVRSLLDSEEVKLLKDALESDEGIIRYAFGRDDGEGGRSRMVLWNQPGNDITGVMARCEKVAGTMEKLLGGEVYHYHTKLMMKDARTGGAFVWHQDYGYWYENGCIFPDMGTVFIALDQATQENGCLKVIPGSTGLVELITCALETRWGLMWNVLQRSRSFSPWCMLSWSRVTRCFSTVTCSTAASRTTATSGAGPSWWRTTGPPTTRS
ncbi:ectoine dioxygenase-like isoform X1 [Branchiostoma floridae x Branchiostoma japonicum]